jgi:hypothetical protein
MTATNHALTGAIIASVVGQPLLALPLAFASHFLLDSLPHYGEGVQNLTIFTKRVWLVDFIVLSSLMLLLLLLLTSNWLLFAGAVAAISPDVAWIYRFVFKEKRGLLKPGPKNKFNTFHSSIQKYETKNGIVIEIVWFIFASAVLFSVAV